MDTGTILTISISTIVMLGGGIGVWVNLNSRVSKMETINDQQEKRIDQMEKRSDDNVTQLRALISEGFDSLRREMREDKKELQSSIVNAVINQKNQ